MGDKLLELIENLTLSKFGDLIVDYNYYWSSKLGIDELALLRKLFNYVDVTVSKRIVDDQLFFLNSKFQSLDDNDWLENGLDGR